MRLISSLLRRLAAPTIDRPAMIEGLETRSMLSVTLPVPLAGVHAQAPIVIPVVKPMGVLIHSEAGESFTGIIGRVHGLNLTMTTGYQAVIDWGDGSALDKGGVLYLNSNGNISIGGTHSYASAGQYTITIKVETIPPKVDPPTALVAPLILATVQSTAKVSDDKEGGVKLTETATQQFTAVMGKFDFSNVDLAFQATITWGDGTSSKGTIERVSGGDYDDWQVVGTHTYGKIGHYKVYIGVTAHPIFSGPIHAPIEIFVAAINSTVDVLGHA